MLMARLAPSKNGRFGIAGDVLDFFGGHHFQRYGCLFSHFLFAQIKPGAILFPCDRLPRTPWHHGPCSRLRPRMPRSLIFVYCSCRALALDCALAACFFGIGGMCMLSLKSGGNGTLVGSALG